MNLRSPPVHAARRHPAWWVLGAAFLHLTLLVPLLALAEQDPNKPEPTAEELEKEEEGPTDRTHATVSRYVGNVANRIDGFFVDERIDEGYNGTRVRLGGGIEIADRDGIDFEHTFGLNLELPRLEKKLRRQVNLVLAAVTDEEHLDDPQGIEEDDSFEAALRFFILDNPYYQLNLDAGVRLKPEPDPLVRLRATRDWPFRDKYILRPTQFLFWKLDDGVGETSRLDFDRRFSARSLARLRGQATWSETSAGVDLEGSVFYFRYLDDLAAIRLRGTVKGRTHPATVATDYLVSVRYRRAIWSNWLFAEVEPEMRFRRKYDYDFTPAITFRVEMILGQDRLRLRKLRKRLTGKK